MNQYLLIFQGTAVKQAVNRGSIHLAVGLPDAYSVVSAKYYFANNLNVMKLATVMDTAAAEKAIRDSSYVYKSRAAVMQSAPSFVDKLKHRTYETTNEANEDSIIVNTDLVKNWSSWSGKVNIAIPTGTPADTSMDTMGMPLGLISKSVFLWLTLSAKNTVGQDTLLYFTKTAAMPVPTARCYI